MNTTRAKILIKEEEMEQCSYETLIALGYYHKPIVTLQNKRQSSEVGRGVGKKKLEED